MQLWLKPIYAMLINISTINAFRYIQLFLLGFPLFPFASFNFHCKVAHTLPVTVLQSFFDVLLLESFPLFKVSNNSLFCVKSRVGGKYRERKTVLLWFFCNLSGHSTLKLWVSSFQGPQLFSAIKIYVSDITVDISIKYSCLTNISLLVSLLFTSLYLHCQNLCDKVY